MAIQWPHNGAVIQLSGGQNARYCGKCDITGKHRVQTFKYRGSPVDPPKNSEEYKDYTYTTWLLTDDGICRGDGRPGDHDFARAVEQVRP